MSGSFLSSARAALDSVFDDTFLRYTRRAMYGGLGLPDNGVPSVPNGAQSVPNGDTSVPNGVKEGLGAILERGYAAPMRSVWEKDVSGLQTISSTKLYEEALREGIGQTAYVIGSPDISPRLTRPLTPIARRATSLSTSPRASIDFIAIQKLPPPPRPISCPLAVV